MESLKYIHPKVISLKNHSSYNEKWLQKMIEEDPSILGLGDLIVRNTEKRQVSGGRLDLLLFDPSDGRRYEVEIQLGKTDESHIIRTIEYWDIERKRNPQYEHCAVIIAEDITSRFLNVISLFNGYIPIIAIQVKALVIGNSISLFFTKVLDELSLEIEDDYEAVTVNRKYWEDKASKESVKRADSVLKKLGSLTDEYSLKYNRYYIGLEKNGIVRNFIQFVPRKKYTIMHFKLEKTSEISEILNDSGLEVYDYDRRWKQYKVKLVDDSLLEDWAIIEELANKSSQEFRG